MMSQAICRSALMLVCLVTGLIFGAPTRAQSIVRCLDAGSIDSGCRIFEPTPFDEDGDIWALMVTTLHMESDRQAAYAAEEISQTLDDGRGLMELQEAPALDQSFYVGGPYNYESILELYIYVFTHDNVVSLWLSTGKNPDFLDEAIYAFDRSTETNRHSSEIGLPKLDDLPSSFSIVEEKFSGIPNPDELDSEENKVKIDDPSAAEESDDDEARSPVRRTKRNTNSEPVEDEREKPAKVTRTKRESTSNSSTSDSASRSSNEPDIVSVSVKDAGIGDGSTYVYVEIENNTNHDYSYVQVDLTCRDNSGNILGTGITNVLGLERNKSAVLTGVILSVPGCTDIDATINPISD